MGIKQKKNQNGRFKNTEIFKTANAQYIFCYVISCKSIDVSKSDQVKSDTAQIQLQMTYKNMFNLGYDSIYTSYFVTL